MVSIDKTFLLLTKVHCLFKTNCYMMVLQAVLVTFLKECHFWKTQKGKHNMAIQLWVLGMHYLINEQHSEVCGFRERNWQDSLLNRKNSSLPVCLLYTPTTTPTLTTLLLPDLCGILSHEAILCDTSWVFFHSTQFWQYLPGHAVRFHIVGALSHKTVSPFRC